MDFRAMATRLATEKQTAKGGGECDFLADIGREVDLGEDPESVQSHTHLDSIDDIENFDTRPKQ